MAYIYIAACGLKIGIELKFFVLEIRHGCIAHFIEVVRQYLARQTHSNAFRAIDEQQWKLCRQCDWFVFASVVRLGPLRHLGAEHRFKGKMRQSRLDVTRSGCLVAGQHVTPVSLGIYQQTFLPKRHQCTIYRGIAVWVILHSATHQVCHLVKASIVEFLHGMQYATLHWLEAVLDVRHGALKYYIRRIIDKPILVHPREMQFLVLRYFICRVPGFLVAFVAAGTVVEHLVIFVFVFFHRVRSVFSILLSFVLLGCYFPHRLAIHNIANLR